MNNQMVISSQEAQCRLKLRSNVIKQKYMKGIAPIYSATISGAPDQIATSLLISIKSRKYLITAAHVVDHNEGSSIYLGCPNDSGFQLIEGTFKTTIAPDGKREKDIFDIAILELSHDFINKCKLNYFINEASLQEAKPQCESNWYAFYGFPNSKNKVSATARQTRIIKPSNLYYQGSFPNDGGIWEDSKFDKETHVVLEYEKRSGLSNGANTNSPSPKGCSGGPIFDLGNLTQEFDEEYIPEIIGMTIEFQKHKRILTGVRLKEAISTLLNG